MHDDEVKYMRAKIEKSVKNLWGLTIHRGWARLLIGRKALLIRRGLTTVHDDDDIIRDDEDLDSFQQL